MRQAKQMMSTLSRRVRPVLAPVLEGKFHSAKQWLLSAVENHEISVAISSHAPSRFLGSATGTLFGFIGFDASQSDPVADLIEFLDNNIIYIPRGPTSNMLFASSIKIPTKNAFNSSSFQVEWTSVGWPLLIEEGISGLPYYLNKEHFASRSLEGIQATKQIRSKDWAGVPYLTPLLAEFRKKLLL